ncbi:hypothetical protein Taro_015262 [Colocasia esculenta]|uniref:DUF7745 domain-containing protein n=1 Tax=Colocasia esculenta TaxID=4460 RepID=A0A843UB23_COLES|nr:hypothetical protein [Colocasia esculenta]
MKRNYLAFAEDIPAYSGPKAARETCRSEATLRYPGAHLHAPGAPNPPRPTVILKDAMAGTHARVTAAHVYCVTAMVELWHPQTNSFIFPEFEATILLEELEIMLGLPRYQRGEELAISYTVDQINSWSILAYITTKKNDLYSMTSGMHVHLLPIAQWIISQCKQKTTNYTAIAKAAAICICGVILFPEADGAISFGNLSIIDFISEVVALELWMGMHVQFRAVEDLTMECKTMLNHPLALTVADFDMRPRFMHGRTIHLPQCTGLALRLLGNGALVSYNPDRCHLQCGAARTVVPLLSHFPPIQERKRGDTQDERDMRSAVVHWEG